MQQEVSLNLLPEEAAQPEILRRELALALGLPESRLGGYYIVRQSLDARRQPIRMHVKVHAYIDEPAGERPGDSFVFQDVHASSRRVIIVGAGPAGLFAALKLLEAGVKPVILERGKDVRARRRDLAALNKQGIVDPDSNYCFGEGGAGTYSDGKLYTRSTKRGNVPRILQLLVHFGAPDSILYDAHPHIGTNKLPHIIAAMRNRILECGGEVHFQQRVNEFILESGKCRGVGTASGERFTADAVILATGHSARDIFSLLHRQNIQIEAKPFALGVRIEHPQSLIDSIQYHCDQRGNHLPAASYSLVEQVQGRGVFSFCMCPGGIIAAAATSPGEIVVNGWSPSKRDNPFANSGIVVSIEEDEYRRYSEQGPLAAMAYQQEVEQRAFIAGGGELRAPAQRLVDFTRNKVSGSLPECSYIPGLTSVGLQHVLPPAVHQRLQQAFQLFGRKMKGYFTNEAVVVATESRTSSPVRIPRDKDRLEHPQISRLYPCGEGAGYAGGIVSAAMDGERVAQALLEKLRVVS